MAASTGRADWLLLAALGCAVAVELFALARVRHDSACAKLIWRKLRAGWLVERARRPPDEYAVRIYGPIDVAASASTCPKDAGPRRYCAASLLSADGAAGASAAELRELVRDAASGLVTSVAVAGAAGDVQQAIAPSALGKDAQLRLRAKARWADAVQATSGGMPEDATTLLVPAGLGGTGADCSWLLAFSTGAEGAPLFT